jgi:hypothetical protein
MGTQGLCSRAGAHRPFAARGWSQRFHYILMVSSILLPGLAGCSSFGALSPGSNQQTAAAPATDEQAASMPYPQQALSDLFKQDVANAAPPAAPSPAGSKTTTSSPETDSLPYPKQSLVSYFQGSGSTQSENAPVRNPNAPRPPSTYTPSAQPYTPPAGQQTYSPAAAPQPAPATQTATAAPAAAAAPPTANSGAYPSQSLFDWLSNKPSQ